MLSKNLFFCLCVYHGQDNRLVMRDSIKELKARVKELRCNDLKALVAYRLDTETNIKHYFDMFELLSQ